MILIPEKYFSSSYLVNADILLIFLLVIFLLISFKFFNKNITLIKALTILIFCTYILSVLGLTLFPITPFIPSSSFYQFGFGHHLNVNLNILDLVNYSKLQIFGNLLLLGPLPILIRFIQPKLNKLKFAVLISLISTSTIEITQLIMSYFYLSNHTFDINDLILNSFGYMLSFTIYNFILVKLNLNFALGRD